MLLGGLWHGAAWTFVLWGAVHGVGLAVNHLWRELGWRLHPGIGRIATLAVVLLAWVPFRADGLDATLTLWRAMALPAEPAAMTLRLAACSAIALLLPNTQVILTGRWRPSRPWALAAGTALGTAMAASFCRAIWRS